ncbi:PREDICTED: uncharacterized protein LOC108694787 [Atta colombica]|uniref:uncharacterized protein LOC108694787 n=1 Tax=Atta colombica TaxID=520822 RepID=UPI00084C63EE|nr:PREDICTED: uncharacterized protein LOC108694787 [Atta colombica]
MKEARNWNDESYYALNVYEKVLGIIGIWPLNAGELKSIARCSLAILIQISTIGSLSLETYWQCLDTEDMMEAFLMDLSSVVSLSKLLVIRFTWKHTYILVTSIIDDWSMSRNKQQREVMMRYTHIGRVVSLTILYLGYASGVSFLFMAVPFDSLIPWLNVSKANDNDTMVTTYFLATYCVFGSLPTITYSCVLLLQAAQIFVNATSHCGNDGFFFGLAMHLCGQFEVLQMDFAGIEVEKQNCKRKIRMLIIRHCHLIRLADNFEYAFNMAILTQVSMSVLLLCVEGMQLIISLKLNDNIAAIKHVVLILTMLVQLYLYCYAGDQLENVTGRIAYSAYDSPWYDFDVKIIKDLPMVILRGKLPHQTTAGKFLPMNLFSFKEILKATGSYLSVLRCLTMKSNTDWNTDTKNILKFHKNFLGIIGLWVLNEKNMFSRIRWFVSTMVETSTWIIMSLEVIQSCNGNEDAMDAFLSSSSSITSLIKLFLHRVYWKQKFVLVESVIQDWTYVKNSHFRDIMLRYARIGRLGSSIYFYIACAAVVFAFSVMLSNINLPWVSEKQIFNETYERKLMLAAYCTFGNYYTSPFAFCAIEALQFVQILVNCISQCGNDGFFFDLTMHMCGQFAILRMNFNALGCDKFSYHNKLDVLLKRHYRLVHLSYYMERAFTLVILAQVLMSVLVLCVEGFLLLLSFEINDAFTAMKHGVYIIALLIQLFLYCFAGQTLEFQSKELAYAIYESPWYSFDVNMMKSIPLIILRATNPQQLTAGKFVPINFITFKEILKASASYLSVLRVMTRT